jgi:hypothetical protein
MEASETAATTAAIIFQQVGVLSLVTTLILLIYAIAR